MTDSYRSEMLRALTGELTAREREAFERALATDDALRAEWERLQKVSGLLQENRADSFRPFFAARVAQRIKSQREGKPNRRPRVALPPPRPSRFSGGRLFGAEQLERARTSRRRRLVRRRNFRRRARHARSGLRNGHVTCEREPKARSFSLAPCSSAS